MKILRYCRVPAVVLVGVLIPSLTLGQTTQARPEPKRQSEDAESRQELDRLAELTSRSQSDRAAQWQCRPVGRNDCGPDGRAEGEPTVWVNLDFDSLRYERCDQSGCDDYLMEVRASGIYTAFTLPLNPGTFLKAVNDGSESVEVVSLGTNVSVYHGRCAPR